MSLWVRKLNLLRWYYYWNMGIVNNYIMSYYNNVTLLQFV